MKNYTETEAAVAGAIFMIAGFVIPVILLVIDVVTDIVNGNFI